MRIRTSLKHLLLAALVAAVAAMMLPSLASAASSNDAFYKYTGTAPLSGIAPGTPLKTRNIPYSILGIPTPLRATQIQYRATDAQGRPTTNVTTVVQPTCLLCLNRDKVISYQSFYDSLNPNDEPSVQIAGAVSLSGIIPQVEVLLFAPFLAEGYSIVIPDTEGQTADFAAGPEYGTNTLDSIRAAIKSPALNLSSSAKVAMMGYSGGAIATEWAAELAPTYAPDLSKNLIGATFGGVLVDPDHNLPYVDGSSTWAGVAPMALIGVARSYGIDLNPYLNDYGKTLFASLDKASIVNVEGNDAYKGLKWTDYIKPAYTNPHSIAAYDVAANKVIMGTGGTPKIPLQIAQGVGGELEGTNASPVYGKGDGVMVAGDVRALAKQYCAKGTKVQYTEYPGSHDTTALQWIPSAIGWVNDRFGLLGSLTIPSNCSSIAAGNSLAPIPITP